MYGWSGGQGWDGGKRVKKEQLAKSTVPIGLERKVQFKVE